MTIAVLRLSLPGETAFCESSTFSVVSSECSPAFLYARYSYIPVLCPLRGSGEVHMAGTHAVDGLELQLW